MAAKRKRLQAPSKQSGFTAVLETMERQHQIFAEQLTGLHDEMVRRFDQVDRRFDQVDRRFVTLESATLDIGLRVKALETKIEALETAVRRNSEDIQRLREQLAELTGVVRGKAEARDVAALAERVARLEARVGL